MTRPTLVIGNRNYSSWSMRAGIALRHAGIDFAEQRIVLDVPGYKEKILAHSASGCVPVLHDGPLTVYDSLAICEYVAERVPALWPSQPGQRAWARSVSAEMHSGFAALREALPMNIRARGRRRQLPEAVEGDIARIAALWTECRQQHAGQGPWLFGQFCIADAMYAPIVSRFITYDIRPGREAKDYCAQVMDDSHVREWATLAAEETEVIEDCEAALTD